MKISFGYGQLVSQSCKSCKSCHPCFTLDGPPHFFSTKITQDVREYAAAQKQIDEQAPLDVGMKEKAEEFVAAGREIYQTTNT